MSPETTATVVPHDTVPPADLNVGETERMCSSTAGSLLVLYGLSRRSWPGLALAGLGGVLLSRGIRGVDPLYRALGVTTAEAPETVEVVQSQSVCAPRAEVYAFWRALGNLPRFMEHLRSVEALSETRSRWTARGPGALPDVSWEADIVDDIENERIVWESVAGSEIDTAGHVRFSDGPDGQTEVHTRIAYRPPAGPAGIVVARWMTPVLRASVRRDIARFEHHMETARTQVMEPVAARI